MLDSFYHMTIKLFCHHVFDLKSSKFCQIYATLWTSLHVVTKICKPQVVYQF